MHLTLIVVSSSPVMDRRPQGNTIFGHQSVKAFLNFLACQIYIDGKQPLVGSTVRAVRIQIWMMLLQSGTRFTTSSHLSQYHSQNINFAITN